MMKIVFCLMIPFCAFAQSPAYPQDYFRNPLNIPILLAGNFGECRPGHFHSGIDIKTEGVENKPVFAAAEGYVSRVKLEPGGFGHGIYITHPNGYTTLYAHLNDFFPELQAFVRTIQYRQQRWEVDTSLPPAQFPVPKGKQIAWSGNTGGSTAPHLHFEIRDTKTEHPLNPMLFGLDIKDKTSPVVSEIALYTANRSVYEQEAVRLRVSKKNGVYSPAGDTVFVSGNSLFLGVAVHDFMEGSANTLSVYTAEWYLEDALMGRLTLDDIGYDETRYLNACADYRIHKQSGVWFNSLFLLPNNKLDKIYTRLQEKNGAISLAANRLNKVKIVLKDAAGNESVIRLNAWSGEAAPKPACNTLWTAGQKNGWESPNLKVSLAPAALYDDICFVQEKMPGRNGMFTRWTVHTPEVPLHTWSDISIRPETAIPFSLNSKIVMVQEDGKSKAGKAATLNMGWYTASFRSFGVYSLAVDTAAPLIKPLAKEGMVLGNKKEIAFLVTDNLSSVKRFSGRVNGQWLCFEQQGSKWFYRPDQHCPKGKNKLELRAEDESGNIRTATFSFTR
ncbi:MAG: M23 family metallopeptidase [Chitinophagaceae bacterium]|nr:M23 family metallopeptidase [Chitinophagaceae bacterium]